MKNKIDSRKKDKENDTETIPIDLKKDDVGRVKNWSDRGVDYIDGSD